MQEYVYEKLTKWKKWTKPTGSRICHLFVNFLYWWRPAFAPFNVPRRTGQPKQKVGKLVFPINLVDTPWSYNKYCNKISSNHAQNAVRSFSVGVFPGFCGVPKTLLRPHSWLGECLPHSPPLDAFVFSVDLCRSGVSLSIGVSISAPFPILSPGLPHAKFLWVHDSWSTSRYAIQQWAASTKTYNS